jgi:hypothetical protein
MGRNKEKLIAAAQVAPLHKLAAAQASKEPESLQEPEAGTEEAIEVGTSEVPAWPEKGEQESGTEEASAKGPSRPDGLE